MGFASGMSTSWERDNATIAVQHRSGVIVVNGLVAAVADPAAECLMMAWRRVTVTIASR